MHQRYNIDFCCIKKISNQLNLAVVNLNDKKTRNCKILVALATCVLNSEYVITNYTYIIENSIMMCNYESSGSKGVPEVFPHLLPLLI